MKGYGFFFDPLRLQLALARADLEGVRDVVESYDEHATEPGNYIGRSALFDGLAALGDRKRIEVNAPEQIEREPYVRPFALRALGLVREDGALIERAAQAFDEIGLAWHAQRTRERKIVG